MFHTPGNHDIVDIHTVKWSKSHPLAGYGPYTRALGPIRWSFDYAGIHFVGLDWARITKEGKLETGVPDMAIRWLRADLKSVPLRTRKFVFMHHYWRPDQEFWKLLAKNRVELILGGHSHRNLDQSSSGVKALTTMNLRGPFRLVSIDSEGHQIVNRCFGCKGYNSKHHSRHCKLRFPAAHPGREKLFVWKQQNVKTTETLMGVSARNLEISMEIQESSAKSFGVRLVDKKSNEVAELSISDDTLVMGKVKTTALQARGERGTQVQMLIKGKQARILVDTRIQFETVLPGKGPWQIVLFSRGDATRFEKVEARQLD